MHPSTPALDISAVVNRSFRLFLASPGAFLGIPLLGALPAAVVLLLGLLAGISFEAPPVWFRFLNQLSSVGGTIAFAASIHATLEALAGRPVIVGESLAIGMRRFFPLFGVSIVFSLCVGLASLLLIVPGIILALTWYMGLPVAVAEDRGVLGSLRRGAQLSKGQRLALFGLTLLFFGIGFGAVLALTVPAVLIGFLIGPSAAAVAAMLPIFCGIVGVYLVSTAMHGIVVAVAYHDLRAVRDAVAPTEL